VCFPGEHKAYSVPIADYLGWVERVESRLIYPYEAAQRIRLLYYGRAVNTITLFDDLIDTAARWASAPLTRSDTSQEVLDGLMRTDVVDAGSGSPGQSRRLVDPSHIWVLLDLGLNGRSLTGVSVDFVDDLIGLSSWTGDLSSAWTDYNDRRLCARSAALSAVPPLTWEEPTNSDALTKTPSSWLERGVRGRSPADDLLGDMDAITLLAQIEAGFPWQAPVLTSLLHDYYLGDVTGGVGAKEFRAVNRYHNFVRYARPNIPHTEKSDGTVSLADGAKEAIRETLQKAIITVLVFEREYHKAWPLIKKWDWEKIVLSDLTLGLSAAGGIAWAMRKSVLDDVQSPWGQAMITKLAADFTAFLQAGLSGGDGWATNGWPTLRSVLVERYGGNVLQIGDKNEWVAKLQADLSQLGFTGIGSADGSFGPRTAIAVREFQIAASQTENRVVLPDNKERTQEAIRRYLGPVNGVVDEETATAIDLWLSPDARKSCLDPGAPGRRGLTGIRNPLTIQSRMREDGVKVIGSVVEPDLWEYNDEKTGTTYVYAFDRLYPYVVPVDDTVPLNQTVAIGRYTTAGGPIVDAPTVWSSTKLLFDHYKTAMIGMKALESEYRVIRAVAEVECIGHYEGLNAWDNARLSFGADHWILGSHGLGELGAFMAFYQSLYPTAYERDFGCWGIQTEKPWNDGADWEGASQAKYEGNLRLYGLRDAGGTIQPNYPYILGGKSMYTSDDYALDYLRSWRALYRIVMALRTSAELRNAIWRFARLRLVGLLARAWDKERPSHVTVGTLPAVFGDVFTSEESVAVLLRWHVNRPGDVINLNGATGHILDAFNEVFTGASINLSEQGSARTDRQKALCNTLQRIAPVDAAKLGKSIENLRAYDGDKGRLKTDADSFTLATA
jgi:hypothetical protein